MLNKQELIMAKELAQELIVVQKNKTKENIVQAFNTIKKALTDLFHEIKDTVLGIWGAVKNTEIMKCDVKKRYFYNWHVPISNLRDSQVMFKASHVPNIRNNI